jgi:glucose/mannose-6-phosphate isomerase
MKLWEIYNLQSSILDDTSIIRKLDKNNMISYCTDALKHYKAASAQSAEKIDFDYPKPNNVVIAGMGGSAIGGELFKDYTRETSNVPVEVSREYQLPAYAGKKTLVILASYSGETEETLSSLVDAMKRKCMICCVSSGGSLINYAKEMDLPYIEVKSGMPPRAALPYMVMPLFYYAEKMNMTPNFSEEFSEAQEILRKISSENSPASSTKENFTKSLAINLSELMPIIYGFGLYRSVALRLKQQFNENAKMPSKWESFSELNHNETMGWENAKTLANQLAVILLREKSEPVEINSRIEITKGLMQGKVPNIFEVWAQGRGKLAKMLSTILLGDFTSVYLAYLRNVDPTPVKTVTLMKEEIEKNGVRKEILRELDKAAKNR